MDCFGLLDWSFLSNTAVVYSHRLLRTRLSEDSVSQRSLSLPLAKFLVYLIPVTLSSRQCSQRLLLVVILPRETRSSLGYSFSLPSHKSPFLLRIVPATISYQKCSFGLFWHRVNWLQRFADRGNVIECLFLCCRPDEKIQESFVIIPVLSDQTRTSENWQRWRRKEVTAEKVELQNKVYKSELDSVCCEYVEIFFYLLVCLFFLSFWTVNFHELCI